MLEVWPTPTVFRKSFQSLIFLLTVLILDMAEIAQEQDYGALLHLSLSKNSTISNMICWVAGSIVSITKRLMFQEVSGDI